MERYLRVPKCSVHIMRLNDSGRRGRLLMFRVSASKVIFVSVMRETSILTRHFLDRSLEVLWYDPQGCIRSEPLDIVQHLPLLLVLISVQYQSPYLSGVITWDMPNYQWVPQTSHRLQLTGRMTTCAYLVDNAATPDVSDTGRPRRAKSQARPALPTVEDATHFFKASWPEDNRHKEGEIIAEARRRIGGLPEEHRLSVEEHIPQVKEDACIPNTSTALIRTIWGLEAEGSRSLYWMISKKLLSLSSILDDFSLFKTIFWEIIRCRS
jgi:hypothetical protein